MCSQVCTFVKIQQVVHLGFVVFFPCKLCLKEEGREEKGGGGKGREEGDL